MNYIRTIEKRNGVDVGYHTSVLEPLNRRGCVGKRGINKNYSLEEVLELAHEIGANIIIKAGQNAKWYLKKFDREIIDQEIEKQNWRDTSRATMWIIELET